MLVGRCISLLMCRLVVYMSLSMVWLCRLIGLLMLGVLSSVLIWFLVRVLGSSCGRCGGFSRVVGLLVCWL